MEEEELAVTEREKRRVAVVGARGHVGVELLRIVLRHPCFEPAFAASRSLAGQRVQDHVAGAPEDLLFEDLPADEAASRGADAWILALPNGMSESYVEAISRRAPHAVIVDVSADHRFDAQWQYGVPELFRDRVQNSHRIANPGCYATGMQLALWPIRGLLVAPPVIFGVSGYSGAGATPSERNDPDRLHDNLLAYQLVGHVHEREVSRHLGMSVHFTPHVAQFFRGISLTIALTFGEEQSAAGLGRRYSEQYGGEPLVRITAAPPEIRDVRGTPAIAIGGIAVAAGGRRGVVVAALDNLLKGAASQAIQNLNLACGFDELTGLIAPAARGAEPPAARRG
ncbi:MAG: N-acetyl-gamma-glutamyl-phosphate reductase [Candidatus Schekmanbacteria bacterium]|nr:N-acetyl-gamma-glutamyl-phosphate reductase [Candidatus Schekmanbacteria bacterium]